MLLETQLHNSYARRISTDAIAAQSPWKSHFESALEENKTAAEYAIGEIQKLYKIERICDEKNLSTNERKQKRQELARPIMVGLKAWMESEGVK